MRPKRLEMTAFGSYAEKTAVDFDALGNGIYLVTGDTGAGKTTIFDAVMFALYGETDKREISMLHSELVPKSEDTFVSLVFETNGAEHKVERRLHYRKNRASGEYDELVHSAVLYEAGKLPTEKGVKERVEAITGLDSKQFRSIVMLPQGEFRKFLMAESGEREVILGKLFDNRIYSVFQESLKNAAKLMKESRAEKEALIGARVSAFKLPEGLSDEEKAVFSPEHPGFEKAVGEYLRADLEKLSEMKEKRAALNAGRDELVKKISEADRVNELIEKSRAAREIFEKLLAEKPANDRAERELERFDRAIHGVLPEKNALERLNAELDELEKSIINFKDEKNILEEKLEMCRNSVKDAEILEKKLENEIKPSALRIEGTLEDYDEADRLCGELARRGGVLETLGGEKKAAEEKFRALESERDEISGKIFRSDKTRDDIREEEHEIKTRLERLEERLESLRELKTRAENVREREELLKRETLDTERLLEEAERAGGRYMEIYGSYLESRAAALSDELRKEVREKGRSVCKVCGTEITSCAGIPEHSWGKADKNDVDEARKARDAAEKALTQSEGRVNSLSAEIEEKKRNILSAAAKLLAGEFSWEKLSEREFIASFASECESERLELRDELTKRENDIEKLTRLEERGAQLDAEMKKTSAELEAAKEKFSAENAEYLKLSGRFEEKKKMLEFSSGELARRELAALNEEKKRLENAVLSAKNALSETEKLVLENNAALSRQKEERVKKSALSEEQRKSCERALSENGFSGEEDFLSAAALCGNSDREEWLSRKREAVNDFKQRFHTAEEMLRDAEKAAEGLSNIDMESLVGRKNALESEISEFDKKIDEQSAKCRSNGEIIEDIGKCCAELKGGSAAYSRVVKLAELASPPSGVKLTFSRYVTQSVFREILGYANIRFTQISRGRYKFVHENEALRSNSTAGLELAILDSRTGTKRHAAAISGGESFIASLSLALGLSDAVQNHAGGISVDTMFIDEGFGSLDREGLDRSIEALNSLASDTRQIGIISHIEQLEESIQRKIRVKNGEKGSSLSIEL